MSVPNVAVSLIAAVSAAGAVTLVGGVPRREAPADLRLVQRAAGSAADGGTSGVQRRAANEGSAVGELAERMAARLRSGASLPEALAGATSTGALEPHLARLRRQLRRGDPLDGALVEFAERGGDDRRLLVAALRMAARHGGRSADALDGVAGTLRDRRAVAAELAAQTSQARLSAWVLLALPPLFLALGSMVDRRLLGALATPAGLVTLLVAAAFELAGWAWIRRILATGARAVGAT
ncbi:MAG: type II secretion system F family protein [Microthrixaceae bacterium]